MLTLDSYLKTVSFEVAKGLKEIGFNEPCLRKYKTWRNNLHKKNEDDPNKALSFIGFEAYFPYDDLNISDEGLETWTNSEKSSYVAAPTIQQVLEYIRVSHGVFIDTSPHIGVYDEIEYVYWRSRHHFRKYDNERECMASEFTRWEFPLHLESHTEALEYGIKKFIEHQKLINKMLAEKAQEDAEHSTTSG